MLNLFQHPPGGRRQAAAWIPACAGMTDRRHPQTSVIPTQAEPLHREPTGSAAPAERKRKGATRRRAAPLLNVGPKTSVP